MNIFFLDKDPYLAAHYHCDKHCVKMILESAQLLSTAHRVLDGVEGVKLSASGRKLKDWILPDDRNELLYTATHVNHPSAVWVRQSHRHYYWLESLLNALYNEYTERYNRVHLVEHKMSDILCFAPDKIARGNFVDPPQCMPDHCKVPGDTVEAYRLYYMLEKRDIAEWRHSPKPSWYQPV